MSIREVLRATVPFAARWPARLLQRRLADYRSRQTFADTYGDPPHYQHRLCAYERPLIRNPGQEAQFAAKQRNVTLALVRFDRLLLNPGEVFSFWRCAGRPTARAGYGQAAALKNRVFTQEVGGALCLASTLLYNVGLLGGLEIVERRCHSIDQYGDRRYFELGRDAAVEYAYLDLRFKNAHRVPLLLRCSVREDAVVASLWSPAPLPLSVEVTVEAPVYEQPITIRTADTSLPEGTSVVDDPGLVGVTVRTIRRFRHDAARDEDLGLSVHHASPRRERYHP